jgi:hypothetical protein
MNGGGVFSSYWQKIKDLGETNDQSTTVPGVMDLLEPAHECLFLDASTQLPALNPNYDPSR